LEEKPIIVGHRANSGRIVYWYKRMGVQYVEVDVSTAPDGRLLVQHGPPGTARATPIGRIAQWVDYKLFYRDPLLRPQPLRVWLRLIREKLNVKGVLVDLKSDVDPASLRREIEESGFDGELLFSTNDHRTIPGLSRELPGRTIIASYSVVPYDIVSCTRPSHASGIGLRIDLLDEDLAAKIRSAGYVLSSWTINTRSQALKALRLGVDIMISDRPDIVARTLEGAGRP